MSGYGVVAEPGTLGLRRAAPGSLERVWFSLTKSSERRDVAPVPRRRATEATHGAPLSGLPGLR